MLNNTCRDVRRYLLQGLNDNDLFCIIFTNKEFYKKTKTDWMFWYNRIRNEFPYLIDPDNPRSFIDKYRTEKTYLEYYLTCKNATNMDKERIDLFKVLYFSKKYCSWNYEDILNTIRDMPIYSLKESISVLTYILGVFNYYRYCTITRPICIDTLVFTIPKTFKYINDINLWVATVTKLEEISKAYPKLSERIDSLIKDINTVVKDLKNVQNR